MAHERSDPSTWPHGRYAGALSRADVAPGARDEQPANELAHDRATLSPGMDAATGRDLVSASEGRRMPVVDDAGRFLGVLALTSDLQFFACRRAPSPG